MGVRHSVLATAIAVLGVGLAAAMPAAAHTVSVSALPARTARILSLPALGGIVHLQSASFATASLGALSGQRCTATTGSACHGFVAVTDDGGSTWRVVGQGGYSAPQVAIARDGRVWAWVSNLSCSTYAGSCRSSLVTAEAKASGLTVVRTTRSVPEGILTEPDGAAVIALDACPTGNAVPQCRGQVVAVSDAGARWRTVWRGALWVGGLSQDGSGVEAVAAQGDRSGRVIAHALRAPAPSGPFRETGTIADVAYAGGANQGFTADVAVSGSQVWAALSDRLSCAMHGCMMDGLYHSGDGGRTWSAVPWPAGAGFCPMPGPSVALAAGRVIATVTSNLAACAPPATVVVAGAATAGALHLAGRLAAPSVEAIGAMGNRRLWAVSQDALLVSADGGRTWRSLWPADVPTQALAFTSARDGLGAGSVLNPGCVLATDDGGRTWHTESCLPLWRVTALDAVNSRVTYLAGIGFGGGTSSELWRTGDGGRTWRKVRTLGGTVDALRLNAVGAGTVVVSTLSGGFGTKVEALPPDGGPARTMASAPDMLQAATVGADGTAYAVTAQAPAGGALLALSRHVDETLASLPTLSWAAVSADGHDDLVAALGVPFPAPGGSRTFGHAYRTELLSRTRGTWRLARLPTLAGAPVAVDFQDASQGWLLTDGMPGVPVLWHTVDGGRSWTALSP